MPITYLDVPQGLGLEDKRKLVEGMGRLDGGLHSDNPKRVEDQQKVYGCRGHAYGWHTHD
jgi:hypothetical protein